MTLVLPDLMAILINMADFPTDSLLRGLNSLQR
jgi:hypothetical protein